MVPQKRHRAMAASVSHEEDEEEREVGSGNSGYPRGPIGSVWDKGVKERMFRMPKG